MPAASTGAIATLGLAILSVGTGLAQSAISQTTSDTTTAAPIAWVYVQTIKGVVLYDAAANGRLTLVQGSPFATTGQMIGSNGSHFLSAGTYWIHSYAVESNGAIGKQLSQVDTQNHLQAGCSNISTTMATLEHTGGQVYVELGMPGSCEFIQTFNIAPNTGVLTYNGITDAHNNPYPYDLGQVLTFTGSDRYAYVSPRPVSAFERQNDGALTALNSFNEHDPTPQQSGNFWGALNVRADPFGHLAMSGAEYRAASGENIQVGPFQLASYSVDAAGNISSTNTWQDMPSSTVLPESLNMSPSGKLLAVAGTYSVENGSYTGSAGLQVFHFNGAAPITHFTGNLLPGMAVYFIRWDNSNHLYAVSDKLYVFTVTGTSVTQAPGSPYALPPLCQSSGTSCSRGLTVVPKS